MFLLIMSFVCHHRLRHHHHRCRFVFHFLVLMSTLFIIIWFWFGERRDWLCENTCMCIEYGTTPVETDTYLSLSSSVECFFVRGSGRSGSRSRSNIDRAKRALHLPCRWANSSFFTFLSHQFHIIDYGFFFFFDKNNNNNNNNNKKSRRGIVVELIPIRNEPGVRFPLRVTRITTL